MTGLGQLIPGYEQIKGKNEHTDTQHQLAQQLAQLIQLPLQGGLLLSGGSQSAGDPAHFGVHAGGGDHRLTTTEDHGRAHVAHIFTVAQGYIVRLLLATQRLQDLVDGNGLAGEGGFLDLHGSVFDDAAVRRDSVTGLQDHHIAGYQLAGGQHRQFSVPQHLAGGGGHGLQGLNGGLGLAFLENAQDGVEQHHRQNDQDLRPFILAGKHTGQGADAGGDQQDDQHGVGQLLKKALDQGGFFTLFQLVWAEFLQPPGGFFGIQALGGGVKGLQDLLRGSVVEFFHHSSSFIQCCPAVLFYVSPGHKK